MLLNLDLLEVYAVHACPELRWPFNRRLQDGEHNGLRAVLASMMKPNIKGTRSQHACMTTSLPLRAVANIKCLKMAATVQLVTAG